MNKTSEFPQEHFVELKGLSPHFVGRITVYEDRTKFNLEIDIVQTESGKIYNHVDSLYGEEEVQDALASAVQVLKNYLDSKKH
jgi:hypothetical protein